MFSRILIAEDFDSYNIAVAEALKAFGSTETEAVAYCDDAISRIRKAVQDRRPFELLITDLSFKPDHRDVHLASGFDLIPEARKVSPDMKIIVYSVENRVHPIRQLIDEHAIDGFVIKGRNNIPELRKAIREVYEGRRYLSPEVAPLIQDRTLEELEQYDLEILHLLAEGYTQAEIAASFNGGNFPRSVSSVEKRLNRLKVVLDANNNVHLVAIAKDLGLI